jgi:hypothetical protein
VVYIYYTKHFDVIYRVIHVQLVDLHHSGRVVVVLVHLLQL